MNFNYSTTHVLYGTETETATTGQEGDGGNEGQIVY